MLIISCKTLIINSNIVRLYQNVTMFYRQELVTLFQVPEKLMSIVIINLKIESLIH